MDNSQSNYANIYLHNSIGDDIMTFVMTKNTSRQRILAYLSQHNGASAQEISLALRVTSANIRYHLALLVSDQLAQGLGLRSDLGRGRPVQVYGLSEAVLGNNLNRLVDVLFAKVLESGPGAEVDSVLESIASALVPFKEGQASGHITRRLAHTIAVLNQNGYNARWEAHAEAPRIIFERCPYNSIVMAHPEMCRIDVLILSRRLGGEIEQTAQLEKSSRGTRFCQFSIRNLG